MQLAFAAEDYWYTNTNAKKTQWAALTFPVSINVSDVRIYNIPTGGTANSTVQVNEVQVNLYSDSAATQLVGTQTISQNIAVTGTDVIFSNIIARVVKITILGVTGNFKGTASTGLAEVEVIASGNTQVPMPMAVKRGKATLEQMILAETRKRNTTSYSGTN